jgi:hypothetical protein
MLILGSPLLRRRSGGGRGVPVRLVKAGTSTQTAANNTRMVRGEHRPRRARAAAIAIAIGIVLGGTAPVADSTPALAACTPAAASSNKVIAGVLHTYLYVNACGAKRLHDEAGKQSASLILPSLAAGWIPGSSGKLIGTALGTYSGLLWLKQNKLQTCTKSFTTSATITFVRSVPTACKSGTRDRPGGGTF